MPKKVTSIDGDRENCLYERISLEFSNTWPGEVYLRFEPFGSGAAIMARVMPGDIVSISNLAEPYETVKNRAQEDTRTRVLQELAAMREGERAAVLSKYRHPSGT